ncbi:MAG: hypothetical protein JSV13_09900 [Nitrospiraceae bacterium]|jgi:hypothetical protein|nr:MAG: hypothetical protein JSV13_09900 [Nitrospiraceae bacterium]
MVSNLQDLKKKLFYDMLDLAGRVFIHVKFDENVIIGERGFLPEEQKRGIILVLNKNMHFNWDDKGISADLIFGSTVQKCFIPSPAIVSLVSPELNAQFSVMPQEKGTETTRTTQQKKTARKVRPHRGEKVIKVNFNRKNS